MPFPYPQLTLSFHETTSLKAVHTHDPTVLLTFIPRTSLQCVSLPLQSPTRMGTRLICPKGLMCLLIGRNQNERHPKCSVWTNRPGSWGQPNVIYSRTYRDYRRVKGWGHYCQVSRQRLFPKVQVLEFEQKSG